MVERPTICALHISILLVISLPLAALFSIELLFHLRGLYKLASYFFKNSIHITKYGESREFHAP